MKNLLLLSKFVVNYFINFWYLLNSLLLTLSIHIIYLPTLHTCAHTNTTLTPVLSSARTTRQYTFPNNRRLSLSCHSDLGDGGMAGGLLLECTGFLTHSHSHAIKGSYANLLRLSIGPSSRLHTSKRYERRNQFLTGRERLTFLRSDAVNWLRFG